MKASKVISIIVAIAIGLIIAVAIKPNANQPEKHKTEHVTKANETSSTAAIKETITKSVATNLDNSLDSSSNKHVESSHTIPSTNNVGTDSAQTITPEKLIHMITLKTNMGDIEVALNEEKAPVSVKNFINYAKNGQYNGTIFHRVINDFMIQGGGFEPGMTQKSVGQSIVNEADNGLKNDKYTIAMARTSDPHSATAQFFINTKDNDFLNHTRTTPSGWGYAVFGEVTKGKEIVDAIGVVPTGSTAGFGDVPREDVVIESVIVSD